ncbi:MAG: lactate utilization protein [Bacteroidetes bacterium]|nr:MAG: lactate utilization protein [Bacteroidota bacterium]
MNSTAYYFQEQAARISFDPEHRRRIDFNIGKYDQAVLRGKQHYRDLELAKCRAANLKSKTINKLDTYLAEFERNFTSRGGKVIWAQSERDAQKEILQIIKKAKATVIVKQKSMVTEELGLNQLLEKNRREVFETDLGEYIVQLAGEKPYHIVTPAMHKSREDVSALFHEKFGIAEHAPPEEIAAFVREKLRKEFIRADVGITGANFLIADCGAVALTENEGNGILTMAFPRIHIAVAGIEKVIPSLEDLDLFLPLLATFGTGQRLTAYNNVLFGPGKPDEQSGPEQMYVVLLDNHRTEVLNYKEQRKALSCIRCGACLNGCPIYRNIGGYTYGTVYSGPIGSVISPHFKGFKDYNHLSFASSLCGKCSEECPVKIPLHELLLYNRREAVMRKYPAFMWKKAIQGWNFVMLHRWTLDRPGASLKNRAIKMVAKKPWGPRRTLPKIAQKSFKERWMEQQSINRNA